MAIAIISLLIIASGVGVSMIKNEKVEAEEIPMVVEHPELLDTTYLKKQLEESETREKKQSSKKDKASSRDKTKSKNTYRRRSPLDEPV